MLIRLFTAIAALALFALPVFAEQKPVADSAIVRDAEVFENQLKATWPTAGKDAKAWRAEGIKAMEDEDDRAATGFFASSVILDKNSAETWLLLARAYLGIETDKAGEKSSFAKNAASAAYIAYERAQTPSSKAAALAVAARALGTREQWRSALRAYKASIALTADDGIQSEYEAMFDEHGFRMQDYTADNESASPRVCVQFSEQLAKSRTDFTDFVTVNGEKAQAVRADGTQLCVEELNHGKRYDIKIRSGLRSVDDDALSKPIQLTVYIRDRKPSVRMTGRNYVLPRTGQQGIPIITTNTKAVKATIYRIGDRRLAAEVLDGDFAKQLEPYQIGQLAEQKGEKLWTGEMPVASKLNEEVTTAFPVDELLPNLKPGLYVLAAGVAPDGPPAQGETDWDAKATQWFIVSDLGLSAFSGQDGVHVFVRSLATAAPIAGTEVRLVARNNEVLGTANTGPDGAAVFEAGLTRGAGGLAPAMAVARGAASDYGFLDLTKQAFDLSDRGVGGRANPGPLDAFVFTERGVYRPGETVYVTAMLRDATSRSVNGTPLVAKLFRPDGVEDRRETLPDRGLGGRSWTVDLPATAMTGTWRVAAFIDPKGTALYERSFAVEDYVPERLEMKLTAATPVISASAPGVINLAGRYLYGAPASALGVEGEVVFSSSDEVDGLSGYRVGQEDDRFASVRKDLEALPNTGATGTSTITVPLPDLPQSSKPLRADVTVRLREPSGRALTDRATLKVETGKTFIGVKPLFSGAVPDGAPAQFEVAGIGPEAARIAMPGLKWVVLQIETRFQWYSKDNRWSYEPVVYENRVAGGTVDIKAGVSAKIEAPVPPGQYRLEVSSPAADGPSTTMTFSSGWYVSDAADTPEILDLALDRPSYRPGDDVKVQILPRMAGKALVAIVSDKVIATQLIPVGDGGASATFKADASWGPGTYATAIVYRPMDSAAKRMPSRAVGVKWIPLDTAPRELSIALETPPSVRPSGPVTVSASLGGLDKGEKAYLVLSGVDVGILNLTHYKTPAPVDYFLGQRRLGLEMRDLYGKLIDGMQGVRGSLRAGGDGGGEEITGRPSAEVPLAVYSGIVEADANGNAQVTFALPPFNGAMRLAAQGWTATKAGHAEKDVIVRDPVVALATPPKFLVLGDSSNVHLSIENVEGPIGTYRLIASADGALSIPGGADKTLTLNRDARIAETIPLQAASIGEGRFTFGIAGPDNTVVERTYRIEVLPPAPNVQRRTSKVLASSGDPLRVNAALIQGLAPLSAQISITASRTASFDVPGLLLSLDRYPFGCAEQTTSRAFPLLYYNEVAAKAHIGKDGNAKASIEKAILRLYDMQSPSGGFGLWGPGSEDVWLTAYVTDFLTRAKEKGYVVRETVYAPALDRLKNTVDNAQEFEKGGEHIAYALYVLTRAGRGVLGDLRYYADAKIDNFSTAVARAQLGAALAMLGDKDRAERAFTASIALLVTPAATVPLAERTDYGTGLRDAAAVLALMGESGIGAAPQFQKAMAAVATLRSQQKNTTTQESLWLLLAARTLEKQNKGLALDVNGQSVEGAFQAVLQGEGIAAGKIEVANLSAAQTAGQGVFAATLSGGEFAAKGIEIKNTGAEAVPATVLVTGAGLTPEPASESGFKIERKTYAPDGHEIPFDKVKQNERVVVVLKATEIAPELGQIVVEDRLPAGFDIENPALLKGSDLKAFSWLPATFAPEFSSFRDDRFIAAFSLTATGRKEPAQLTMAYVIRAVNPGVYTHAGARVEDMYRPDRFARTGGSQVEVVAAP